MKVYSLVILCIILSLVSACNGQLSLSTPTAFQTQASNTLSPLPTNSPRPTHTPSHMTTATETPVPPTATLDISLTQTAITAQKDRDATAQVQTATASFPMTATAIVQLNQTALPSIVIPEAWVAVRAVLPSNIFVYMPTFVPARFGSPEIFEVNVNEPLFSGPVYTIGYWKRTDNGDPNTVVFILNNGQGSWGAEWTGPGFTTKSIKIDGMSGEFYMIPGENSSPSLKGVTFYRASWKKQGQYYQVKAISSRMTEAEFMQIVHSLVLIKR